MFNALYNALLEWNRTSGERQKMQHAYLIIVILSVIVAGLVSLVDVQSGQDLLLVSVVSGGIFLVNAVLWSLLESVIVARLSNRRKK